MTQLKRPFRDEDRPILSRQYAPRPMPDIIPSGDIFTGDDTYCFLPMNCLWLPHFLGVMSALDQYDSWVGTDEEKAQARHQIRSWMASITFCVEEEMAYLLRQSTENPCVLEQSIDDGETWTEAFNYALCLGDLAQLSQQVARGDIERWRDVWDGGTGQDQLAPLITLSDDTTREQALCAAIEIYLRAILAAAKKRREGQSVRDILYGAVRAAILATMIYFTGGLGAAIASAVAAAVGFFAIELIESLDEEEYDDEDAMHEVVCCVYDQIVEYAGVPLEQSGILEAAYACYTSLGAETTAGKMALLLNDTLNDIDAYVTFLVMAEQAYVLVAGGEIACSCQIELDAFCRLWNLRESEYDWELVDENGNWLEGFGYRSDETSGFTDYNVWRVFDETPVIATKLKVRVVITSSTAGSTLLVYLKTSTGNHLVISKSAQPVGERYYEWSGRIGDVITISVNQDGFGRGGLKEVSLWFEAEEDPFVDGEVCP